MGERAALCIHNSGCAQAGILPFIPGAPPIPQSLVEIPSHQFCYKLYGALLQLEGIASISWP